MSTKRKTRISATLEDYLEAILNQEEREGTARVRDIAASVSVHKSTVTAALHALSEKRLVNYVPYGPITLTESGRRIAERVKHDHDVIRTFLRDILLVDDEVAEENACRMEHAVDSALVERLTKFVEFIHDCPRAGEDWVGEFAAYCSKGETGDCDPCVARVRKAPQRKAT